MTSLSKIAEVANDLRGHQELESQGIPEEQVPLVMSLALVPHIMFCLQAIGHIAAGVKPGRKELASECYARIEVLEVFLPADTGDEKEKESS